MNKIQLKSLYDFKLQVYKNMTFIIYRKHLHVVNPNDCKVIAKEETYLQYLTNYQVIRDRQIVLVITFYDVLRLGRKLAENRSTKERRRFMYGGDN